MHVKKNGYVAGAILILPHIQKIRKHVEMEKFLARILKDDETTRLFKDKTQALKNKLHAFRYNNPEAYKMTAAGKKENGSKQ